MYAVLTLLDDQIGECKGNMNAAESTEKFGGRAELLEGFREFVNAPSFNRPSFPQFIFSPSINLVLFMICMYKKEHW